MSPQPKVHDQPVNVRLPRDLHEGDLCRCCNGTGSRPPVPKKENESNE